MLIFAIIVTYHPDAVRVGRLVATLQRSNCRVIIVDNTEGESKDGRLPAADGCQVIELGDNFGIAHAQNVGIRRALEAGAEIVLYFDQDSVIQDDFVATLVGPLTPGQLGVVAPTCWAESGGGELCSQRLNRFGLLSAQYSLGRISPYPVDVVIASGMAVTAKTFAQVGLMDEDFFIDWVDTEWSLRCRARGVPMHVVPAAQMRHTIGGRTVDLGIIRLVVHNPVRCYYQIRNGLLLLRRKHVPTQLALVEAGKVMINRALLLIVVRHRRTYLMNYLLAVVHGMTCVVGKLPSHWRARHVQNDHYTNPT